VAFDLKEISESIKSQFKKNETINSFPEFISIVEADPYKYCRNSAQYLKDVFDHYGYYKVQNITGEKIKRWKIFDEFGPVFGQERAQNQIYNYVSSFAENRINKIILLHGPNGSAKTSIINAIMLAMEAYSKLPEGALYTFNWIFSDSAEHEVDLGFGGSNREYNEETLAYTKPEEITFKLICKMKDNPLLLIPKEERTKFLEEMGIKRPHYLYDADLTQKSNEIFNQLLTSYEGDWTKVIRHVQVERFYFSKLFRKGLISIDPQRNVDANSRALNLEQSYKIPRILAMSSIYEPYGDLVDANRGAVELSEIFKRHVNDNKYLLTTAEWGTISLPGFTAQLDCLIFATDNEKTLSVFKATTPDWPSFNGRFAYVRVPYILRISDEQLICEHIIKEHVKKTHVSPHTINTLALWAILTRLRESKIDLAKKLTFTEKAHLYDSGQEPTGWTQKDRQNLRRDLKDIALEYEESRERILGKGVDDASYEGRSGASYRDVENIVINAINKRKYLSPLALFTTIEEIIKNDSIYEFTKLHRGNEEGSVFEKGFLDPNSILSEVKQSYCKKIQQDLRESAGLISDEEYDKLFDRYIKNVKAWTKNEKIQNPQTGAWEVPSENLMLRVEAKMGIDESEAKDRRKGIFAKIAAYSLKANVDLSKGIPYNKLFSDLMNTLRRNSDTEQREQLERIQKSILKYKTDDWKSLEKAVSQEDLKTVTQTIDKMLERGYTMDSLKEAVVFLMTNNKTE
jgi:predicted Ser/Thr protein kinase